MRTIYQHIIDYSRKINWVLLAFLLLVLNVKLIIKVVAIILIAILQYRNISIKKIVRQRSLYFYFAMIGIAVINFLLQARNASPGQAMAVSFGIGLWMMAAAACFLIYQLVQKEEQARLHHTLFTFFVLHIAATLLKLLWIMVETGAINPYVYTGMHQKYYISTGDYITGITFDSPVTTAAMSGFALVYFLYRHHYALSIAAMASLLIVGSNLVNLFVVAVLLFIFIFRSTKAARSMIIVQSCMLMIFVVKISPQNNEHVGRLAYKLVDKPYDLPKKNTSLNYIKQQPDSLLSADELKRKQAQLYIDSISAEKMLSDGFSEKEVQNAMAIYNHIIPVDTIAPVDSFHIYEETKTVAGNINRYRDFSEREYSDTERAFLQKQYDWHKPGKWTALLQLIAFSRQDLRTLVLGAGTANFSSRTAFKATGLNIAGSYPQRWQYINPLFRDNHLYVYLHYHAQAQDKHAAENTPDSTYYQLLGEYGLIGVLAFLVFYVGYFARRWRQLSFGIPVLLLLLGLFMVEYWFEQLSIVVLAEAMLFIDLRSHTIADQRREELAV